MVRLYDYQREGVRKIEEFGGRALLADVMGLGKTPQAIVWIKRYAPKDRPTVIVVPASIKWNWRNEIRSWGGGLKTKILSTRTYPRNAPTRAQRNSRTLYVINYDVLSYWKDWLRQLDSGTVIFDECHYIKNRKAKRTKAAKSLALKAPHVLMLSGTPLTNRPAELFPILNMIDRKRWPDFFEFCMKYAKPKKTYWGWDFSGAKNLDKLHRKLKRTCMIRRRKEDVLKELPNMTRMVLPVSLPPKAMQEYNKADRDFMRWLVRVSPGIGKKAGKIIGRSKMKALLMLTARLMSEHFVGKWIEDFHKESDSKLIVFGIHHDVLKPLYAKFKKSSVLVNGEIPAKRKHELFEAFKTQKSVKNLFGNIQAAGVGWDGTESADVLFAEIAWTSAEMSQAEKRVDRIGQTKGSRSVWMVAKGTVMERLCEIVQSKQDILDQTLDGKKTVDRIDVYDLLIASYKRRKK